MGQRKHLDNVSVNHRRCNIDKQFYINILSEKKILDLQYQCSKKHIFEKQFILFVSQNYEYALIKLNEILVCCHLIHKKSGLQSLHILFLNYILSSRFYLAVRYYLQIQSTCLSFQIDSPLQLNTYNISQPLFTCSNSLFY